MDRHTCFIDNRINENLSTGDDDAFFVFDIEDVRMKYHKWIEKMPRVVPFYAVKCNSDKRVLKVLEEMGTGFDCASKGEILLILGLGVAPERIIYANPVKQVSHVKKAEESRVMKLTFDNSGELLKIKSFHPKAQVVLRIRFDAEITSSGYSIGPKFGCDPTTEAPELVKLCKEQEMNLIGICFHVGTKTQDYDIYESALATVRRLFDFATGIGFNLTFVDIGGGFVGSDLSMLDHYADSINRGIDKYFPDPSVAIISEPGRYFVESAFTLAVQITMKKISHDDHANYYINDGIHMSFMFSFICEEDLDFEIIRKTKPKPEEKKRLSTIWGVSCNPTDKIISNRMITELEIGDWLVFHNMGAYSTSLSALFNGFQVGEIFPIDV